MIYIIYDIYVDCTCICIICIIIIYFQVREYCLPLINNIVSCPERGIEFGQNILLEVKNYMMSSKVVLDKTPSHADEIPISAFIDSILAICSLEKSNTAGGQKLALNTVICAHYPLVMQYKPDLWENVLSNLNLDPKSFISLNRDALKTILLDEYQLTPSYEHAIGTVSKLSPEVILPILIEFVIKELNNTEMCDVTDDEYFTYLTPKGELYDKSVIPNSEEIYQSTGLKRENKVYSYKEQLEELQLRREIEEKRRKEGKAKPLQLTPKQMEAIKNQTEKENAIKSRLKELENRLLKVISLIEGAANGNPEHLSLYYNNLLPAILRVFSSPLAATHLTKLYFKLRLTVFNTINMRSLGEQIAIATIRIYQPHCDLDDEWQQIEINELVSNVIIEISDQTVAKKLENPTGEGSDDLFVSSAFCYVFEFLKKAVYLKSIREDEMFLLTAIDIITVHAQMRGTLVSDNRHPKYMPRLEMIRLLLSLIETHRGRIQTQSVAALLEVAYSSSGNEFCDKASRLEIELLLRALENCLESVRDVSLRSLDAMMFSLPTLKEDYDLGLRIIRRLFVARHDVSEENRLLAESLWNDLNLELPAIILDELRKDIIHPELCIQKAAALSIVAVLREDPSPVNNVLSKLLETYNDKLTMIPPKLDQFGRELETAIDPWGPRRGVAIALCQISQFFSSTQVHLVMQFMVKKGLGDREEIVHKEMLAAALTIVDIHGKETVAELLPVFESFLDKAPDSSNFDNIRQAVVILMGSLARHLDRDDEKIKPIVMRLITALSTPSQTVQEAVANCLPHLMPSFKNEAPGVVKKLLNQLVKSEKYGERRGAAYGIAGVAKGLGILSLKQLDIMTKLTNYIQDKKNAKAREGKLLFRIHNMC